MGLLDRLSGSSKAGRGVKEARQMIEQGSAALEPYSQFGEDIMGKVRNLLMGGGMEEDPQFQMLAQYGTKMATQQLSARGKSLAPAAFGTAVSGALLRARNEVIAPYMQSMGMGAEAAGGQASLYGQGAQTLLGGRVEQGRLRGQLLAGIAGGVGAAMSG